MSKQRVLKKDVEAAEKAAQRSVCNLPDGPTPDELKQALKRRVEVSWEAAQTSGVLQRLGGADERVRRLEQPWSKRRTATADDESAPKSSGDNAEEKATSTDAGATTEPDEGAEEGSN